MVGIEQLDDSVRLQTQDEGTRPESPTEGCELPVVGRTATANTATTVPREDSTITTSIQEDNATDHLDGRLSMGKELFESLPTVLRKPIESHILKAIHRNETKLEKMQGIAN